jgi:hypothetical protein
VQIKSQSRLAADFRLENSAIFPSLLP